MNPTDQNSGYKLALDPRVVRQQVVYSGHFWIVTSTPRNSAEMSWLISFVVGTLGEFGMDLEN